MNRSDPMIFQSLNLTYKKISLYLIAGFVLLTGFYFVFLSIRRAIHGSPEALWTLITFFAVTVILSWIAVRFWHVILDTKDILDVFRSSAKEKKSKVESVLRRTDRTNLFFKEQGYRFLLRDYSLPTEISLIQIEIETPEHFIAQSHSYYLTFHLPYAFAQPIAFIHPKISDWHQPDLWLYCPQITMMNLLIVHPAYHVFTLSSDQSLREVLENPFITNDLNVLFSLYRLNFIFISSEGLRAVKESALESFAYDVEAYHILHRLFHLLREHEKINTFHTQE